MLTMMRLSRNPNPTNGIPDDAATRARARSEGTSAGPVELAMRSCSRANFSPSVLPGTRRINTGPVVAVAGCVVPGCQDLGALGSQHLQAFARVVRQLLAVLTEKAQQLGPLRSRQGY